MIALLAHHRLYNIIAYSLEHYCLLYVYRLIYREGKGGHSGIVCKASAQGHSVTLWKASAQGHSVTLWKAKGKGNSDWSMHYR